MVYEHWSSNFTITDAFTNCYKIKTCRKAQSVLISAIAALWSCWYLVNEFRFLNYLNSAFYRLMSFFLIFSWLFSILLIEGLHFFIDMIDKHTWRRQAITRGWSSGLQFMVYLTNLQCKFDSWTCQHLYYVYHHNTQKKKVFNLSFLWCNMCTEIWVIVSAVGDIVGLKKKKLPFETLESFCANFWSLISFLSLDLLY